MLVTGSVECDFASPASLLGGDNWIAHHGEAMSTHFVVRRVPGEAWDHSLPMRDQKLWAEHAAFMNDLAADGLVVLGGPIGIDNDVLLIVAADNEEVLRTRLAADPWTKSGLLKIGRVEVWRILLNGRNQ